MSTQQTPTNLFIPSTARDSYWPRPLLTRSSSTRHSHHGPVAQAITFHSPSIYISQASSSSTFCIAIPFPVIYPYYSRRTSGMATLYTAFLNSFPCYPYSFGFPYYSSRPSLHLSRDFDGIKRLLDKHRLGPPLLALPFSYSFNCLV